MALLYALRAAERSARPCTEAESNQTQMIARCVVVYQFILMFSTHWNHEWNLNHEWVKEKEAAIFPPTITSHELTGGMFVVAVTLES